MPEAYSNSRPHPWHGLDPGPHPPTVVHAYIEITPFDLVKYEIDKSTGYLRVDRAQRTSSLPPALYGFIPQTYCAARVAKLMPGATRGDLDPLDICVISERPIARAEVIVNACVIGGLPMLDGEEADDKIIAILKDDPVFGHISNLAHAPDELVGRLAHYFATYKLHPNAEHEVRLGEPYPRSHAEKVVLAAIEDYADAYPGGGSTQQGFSVDGG
ncbi:MAG: inorganic pyrophosphatase [Bacteroidota bacterium]